MGRQARRMNWRSFGGGGDKGPWSKEKRRSLKLASQTRGNVVAEQRWTEVRLKGRMMKM